ncbi:MAG: DUF362 domain-containing protein [Candidatus Hodarchaeota archaeon]
MEKQIQNFRDKSSSLHNNFKTLKNGRLKFGLLFFSLISILWFIFRTGSKPSRITYPCQRAAMGNLSFSLTALVPLPPTISLIKRKKNFLLKTEAVILLFFIFGVVRGELIIGICDPNPFQEIQLMIKPKTATNFPASDIFVVNNQRTPKISELIELMSLQNLYFYKSSLNGENQGPEGLIARDDIVLLKINSQWPERGGTNTDILKDLIQIIIVHPDDFIGEIIVADNGQGYGSMDHTENNAENKSQSTQDVVDMFFSICNISTYDWADIRSTRVGEFSEGDLNDGYIRYETPDPETGIFVSYPKFKSDYGTCISFKHGLWNGTNYENRIKVINLPVLKSHLIYGTTASLKNYMGVQSEIINGGLANGHTSVATGGMGTLMVECGLPTLNIIDAVWINANPYPNSYCGPSTEYYMATRVNMLIAGLDPVALDYWATKYVLVPTARSLGYEDINTLDPENVQKSGLEEAFGVWLELTKNELLRNNFNFTTDENRMNIITNSSPYSSSSTNVQVSSFEFTFLTFISYILVITLFSQKRRRVGRKYEENAFD